MANKLFLEINSTKYQSFSNFFFRKCSFSDVYCIFFLNSGMSSSTCPRYRWWVGSSNGQLARSGICKNPVSSTNRIKNRIQTTFIVPKFFNSLISPYFNRFEILKITQVWLKVCLKYLTPQGQLSLQGTFRVWTDVKVLWTKADEGEAEM